MSIKALAKKNYLIPAGILFTLLISLYLMSHATQASSQFNELFSALILLNIAGTLLLFGLLVSNINWLWQQFKKQAIGSKITARIVLLFLAISVVPTGIVFYFSNQLLHQSVDSWFNAQIDKSMQNALLLSKRSLDAKTRNLLKDTRTLAEQLTAEPDFFLSLKLTDLRSQSNADELTALSKQGRIIATTNINPNILIPNTPDESILLRIKQSGEYVGLEPNQDDSLIIRVLVEIKNSNPRRFLQAIYAVPSDLSILANSVESAYSSYKEFSYLRQSLKFSFTLTLSLVLLFSILASSWVAFIFARQLVEPIRQLVRGTQAIARGNYEKKLKVTRNDELGFLVESFNDMTLRISQARQQAQTAQQHVEDQHAYLETVLSHLSNGVLSVDLSCRLKTSNQGADNILGHSISSCSGYSLSQIAATFPELEEFTLILNDKLTGTTKTWEQEFIYPVDHTKKTLLLRGAPLFAADKTHTGYVIVFDDVTPIILSQRNAAWSEVARRLAHEIKNPLTPIQLSAERLQRKLHNQLDEQANAILNKSTNTIIQQVGALKSMVDDFSDFARPPQSKLQVLSVAPFIEDILSLYQGQIDQLSINIEGDLPQIFADPVRLRQVLINLIKNAQEAIEPIDKGIIKLSVRHLHDSHQLEISLADNGPGVDNSQIEHIFEPYVTSKPKGTGLGLAIVKKIIEEHGGHIHLQSHLDIGATFIIHIPIFSHQSPNPASPLKGPLIDE